MSDSHIKSTSTFIMGTALLAIPLVAMLLSSCGGLEEALGGVGGSISINADSGNQRSLEGTWVGCYYDGVVGGDISAEYVVANTSLTETFRVYPSTGGSCTGTAISTSLASGTMAIGMEVATSGWHNGSSPVTAPMNQAGAAPLADPPQVTGLIITDDATSVQTQHFFYMDDSASPWCIYSALNSAVGGSDLDGYPAYVFSGLVACKV